jgi:hypothetical protein
MFRLGSLARPTGGKSYHPKSARSAHFTGIYPVGAADVACNAVAQIARANYHISFDILTLTGGPILIGLTGAKRRRKADYSMSGVKVMRVKHVESKGISRKPAVSAAFAVFVGVMLSFASIAHAGFVDVTLGTAGPEDFAILALTGANDIALNGPTPGTNGNVGISSGTLSLNGSAGPAINGNVLLAPGASISTGNGTQVTGTVFTNQNLSQPNTDARNASTTFANLTPTLSVPGGAINGTITINGTAGVNVVNVSGINLGNGQTLTLNGPAGSQFVLNDSGNLTLNSGLIKLAGGLTPTDVVINDTSSGNNFSTSGGLNNESIINAIVLDPNGGVAMAPGKINGELIAGGSTIHLVSGANVNGIPVTPLPAALPLFSAGLGLVGLLGWRRKRAAAAIAA